MRMRHGIGTKLLVLKGKMSSHPRELIRSLLAQGWLVQQGLAKENLLKNLFQVLADLHPAHQKYPVSRINSHLPAQVMTRDINQLIFQLFCLQMQPVTLVSFVSTTQVRLDTTIPLPVSQVPPRSHLYGCPCHKSQV